METWLTNLISDLATESMETAQRHRLLVDALAPLGPVDAETRAHAIEEPAYWVRVGTHQTGADRRLADAVSMAVFEVQRTFTLGRVA